MTEPRSGSTRPHRPAPRRVAVVGAGMVGLSTAWFLADRGVEVTVLDRTGVAAGSSWGNAGWLTPGLATPLPEPAVLRYGVRAVVSPSSPVYVPLRADVRLLSFMARFAAHSTASAWRRAMAAMVPINRIALESFDLLDDPSLDSLVHRDTTFLAAYRTAAERTVLLEEVTHMREVGQELEVEQLSGDEARALEPTLSPEVGAALRLYGQRHLAPAAYVAALGKAVAARGVTIREGVEVAGLLDAGDGVEVAGERYDAVVVATGAWLGHLVRPFGVRTLVQAGRGYSFSVAAERVPGGPLYFPTQRVACTPDGDRLRVAGMMEFRPADAPLDPRRVDAIVAALRPLVRGLDLDDRADEWVGSRPCTPDGLPLVGATRSPRVFVAGGHGMWGVTLGPATGRLLADQVVTGVVPAELAPFDPLR